MSKPFSRIFLPAFLAGFALTVAAAPALAQEEGPVPTTALITVQSKSGAPLNPSMLHLKVDGHDAPITDVAQIPPAAAQIAILIDDGLRFSFSNQLSDFADFINGLPAGTKVLVGYMRNGIVLGNPTFSADHAAVAHQLRMPIAIAGVDASPYFTLSNFVKNWPSNQPGARFVLMITNGIDPYNGSTSIMNQDSPYVQNAQEDAERAGVAVYSIYYGQSFPRRARGSFSGQSYLEQVAEATGGDSFYIGTITPPSLAPYLKDFSKSIAASYMVAFKVSATKEKKDTLTQIKLTTSQPGVKIHAPHNVHPGVYLQ
ncbi:MAG: hypothetical protein HIU91_03240 [Acidobacteria bacterium]|nr:hypothetical protein [Acidobacteriota bacterium]